jgi:heparosan-N-sulfate-glucuronate 5-epimerase
MSDTSASSSITAPRAPAMVRVEYLARVLQVYARPASGPLSFWHEEPEVNESYRGDARQYFMRFGGKANYAGPFDASGIPLLDYRGRIGRQYNPIAVAHYGLARFNRWCQSGDSRDRTAWLAASRWLVANLQSNDQRVPVWVHHFDWQYRQVLKAPWYSGLAQGNGVSMLVRAATETGDDSFAEAAHRAFQSLELPIARGGVLATDTRGDVWIEEYIVDPPSHVLNGFIWALWGVYDYARWSRRPSASALWDACVRTLEARLDDFDTGWWSLYEAPTTGHPMLASLYYHRLHAVQLRVLHELTGIAAFATRAARFEGYARRPVSRARAFVEKACFKLRNY